MSIQLSCCSVIYVNNIFFINDCVNSSFLFGFFLILLQARYLEMLTEFQNNRKIRIYNVIPHRTNSVPNSNLNGYEFYKYKTITSNKCIVSFFSI